MASPKSGSEAEQNLSPMELSSKFVYTANVLNVFRKVPAIKILVASSKTLTTQLAFGKVVDF